MKMVGKMKRIKSSSNHSRLQCTKFSYRHVMSCGMLFITLLVLLTGVGAEVTKNGYGDSDQSKSLDVMSSLLWTQSTTPKESMGISGNDDVNGGSVEGDSDGDVESVWNMTEEIMWIISNGSSNFTRRFFNNNSSGAYNDDGYRLYDVPVYLVVLLSLLYGIISITAVIGNLLVLWVVTVSRRMRTKTNLFIGNLALADVIIGLFAIPFQFQAALLQRWNLPDFMCAFCPFIQVLSVNVSVFTLSAIALDRYRAIIYPFRAIRTSKRETSYTVFFIWVVSIGLALPQELDYRVILIGEGATTKPFCAPVTFSPAFHTYYTLGLAVVQYVFPLLIISGAYAKMAAKLWGATAPGNREENRDENSLRNKKKVVKMLALVVLLFAVCWLPLQMYNFLQTITSINEYQYINIIWFTFHWLAMSNSCYNPFIYAIYSDKFQTEFRLRLHCLRRKSGDGQEYCSDASDFDMSRVSRRHLESTRLHRMSTRCTRTTLGKANSVDSTKILDLQRRRTERITCSAESNKPIVTICNNVKPMESILATEYPTACSIEIYENVG